MTLKQLSQIPLLSYSTLRVNANKQDIPQLESDMGQLYNKRYVEQDINYESAYRAYSHTLLMKKNLFDRLSKAPYIYDNPRHIFR
jgi:tRNA A37 threonylcarbamoyladenosine modification protein TsaB